MSKINIVLHEPEIPQNTGNIARTCAATGASLHLIRPLGFAIDDRKLKRAGLDYWHQLDITYYDNLDDFYAKHPDAKVYYFSTKAQHLYTEVHYPDPVYIMFGKETKGLPEELLHANPDACVRLPMRDGLRSLNLSNSVAIAVYEILRQGNFEDLKTAGELTTLSWEDA
ncbi:MAG: tRNA (uridine(34)/cytosine(34)/5-carboxymethylaminomethyluridine(34)-2'-O)-methyltransferase TrmL [Clostridia bacterium]|nr:tRNA (uridine(34)/cytosine(34)/5-carboxymethylaminomethyluridine(34)-2'-O)-methyltransferase TrmL [Clostridia bacterium]